MIRIVAVADTHLYHKKLSVPDGDILIHAGDLAIRGGLEEIAAAAAWIKSLPHACKIVVAGNHDGAFEKTPAEARALLADPRVVYLEDAGVYVHRLAIWGSPWQPAYGGWSFNLPRGPDIRAKWDLIPAETDILVTHGPARGHGDRCSMAGREGCDDLRDRIREVKPIAHFFGHIHEDGGLTVGDDGVHHLNVTTWECTRAPTVVDVDVDARKVVPVVVPPSGNTYR